MKKSLNLIFVLVTLLCVFAFTTKFNKVNVKAEEISRINFMFDQNAFNYYFNVAYTEGELDEYIKEIFDVDDKSKYYIDFNNTYIMYCF